MVCSDRSNYTVETVAALIPISSTVSRRACKKSPMSAMRCCIKYGPERQGGGGQLDSRQVRNDDGWQLKPSTEPQPARCPLSHESRNIQERQCERSAFELQRRPALTLLVGR